MVSKGTNLSDALILATPPRCEEGSVNLPNQFFPTPLKVNTVKQLLKDTTEYISVKIGAQTRASLGHLYKIVLDLERIFLIIKFLKSVKKKYSIFF